MLTEEKLLETKRIVKKAMRGFMPEEKTRAWRSVYNYMRIADLQEELALSGEALELGEGNYAADVMIVTATKPTKEELEVLRSILRAIDIPETEIYRTIYSDQALTEVSIIQPAVAIYFGHPDIPVQSEATDHGERTKMLVTHSLPDMLPTSPNCQASKAEAWASLKEIMRYYDEVKEREKM